ncbi:EAL domain-containing protein [Neptunicella sp. SCSIO 80796]|uniref:EAL domain-containing protein n=1 Tax=Neptunicella plasticusilytica TaxID=3117012 RepID=UPI003A4D25DF
MSDIDDGFVFADERKEIETSQITPWYVLSVEDNQEYQETLVSSLKKLKTVQGHPIQILTASSAFDAASILSQKTDIALVLLDVVMEDDDAGLRLVKTIREVLGNASIRIVLLTGQPGFAPEKQTMQELDIDEYWNKSDLTTDKLHSIVTSNLRTWHYIVQLIQAQQGLQMVIDAARTISSKSDIASFTNTVLTEIGKIVGIEEGGIMCVRIDEGVANDVFDIVEAIGCYQSFSGAELTAEELYAVNVNIANVVKYKTPVLRSTLSIFYFETSDIDNNCYLMVVKSNTPINDANINLLQVFSENISSGFTNIALLNRLTAIAYTDQDLDIPNRNWLLREIHNMNHKERIQSKLLLFDIKQFEEISFAFGSDFCLNVLRNVYQNIRQLIPQPAPIALSNAQQFAALLPCDSIIDESLQEQLTHQQFKFNDVVHNVDLAVIEMTLDNSFYYSASKILNLAESSLKEALQKPRSYVIHTQQDSQEITRRYDLMGALRNAIKDKTLSVMLQPKVRLNDGKVVGFEALARWQLEDRNYVRPDEFIPIAETAGLIYNLDCLIFEKTLEAVQQLREENINLPVAFNASSFDIQHPHYYEFIRSNLANSGLSSNLFELEVTESQAMEDYQNIKTRLQRFVDLGLKISIDDFGTGHSSLSHISHLTANYLKIDRSFVNDIENDEGNKHIVQMILDLGHQFGFNIIAEGIENSQQQTILKEMGCEIGQGCLFAKPMPVSELIPWLKQQTD